MRYVLFTTTSCPKCPAVKAVVSEKVSFEGEILDETSPGFGDRISAAGVTNAPTFIVYDGEEEVFRGSEVYEIEGFLDSL